MAVCQARKLWVDIPLSAQDLFQREERRGTQVAKGEVCKTSIRRFESDPRLQAQISWPGLFIKNADTFI